MSNSPICVLVFEHKGITYSAITENRVRAAEIFKEFNTGRPKMTGMIASRKLEDFTDIDELREILNSH